MVNDFMKDTTCVQIYTCTGAIAHSLSTPEAGLAFSTRHGVSLIQDAMKDSDWLYKAITVPWLSHDPVNLVENSGFGFDSIFDETNELTPVTRSSLRLEDWEFVAVWQAEFPGWNMICWLVFRRRAGRAAPSAT